MFFFVFLTCDAESAAAEDRKLTDMEAEPEVGGVTTMLSFVRVLSDRESCVKGTILASEERGRAKRRKKRRNEEGKSTK